MQPFFNVAQRRFNVVSTLTRHYLNVVSMRPQRQLKLYRASEKYGFAERLVSFVLLNEKIFCTIY